MRNHDYWVYGLPHKSCSTLYIGIANNILRHDVRDAIAGEEKFKGCRRIRKIALIEKTNPRWLDLSDDWEQQSKIYDRPWNAGEMIRDSSPATAGSE